jgi:MoaA/NifB/PqqE/SkfB family radical SAM enzyme
MYWNVHVDGLEFTHDLIVEREGVFKECVAAIKMAKILGYQTATNTTVYKETDVQELEDMFQFLSSLNVDGHTISPGYEYDAAKKDMVAPRQTAGRFLPHPQDDAAEIRPHRGVGQELHHLRHAGVSGISRRQTRV